MGELLPDLGEVIQVCGDAVGYGIAGYMLLWGLGHIVYVIKDGLQKGD